MTAARAARITAAAIAVIAMAFALWYSRTAILLAFAGILLAIVLYGASRALSELTNIPRLAMLALVAVSLALGLVLLAWTAGPTLTQQIAQLAQRIAAGASPSIDPKFPCPSIKGQRMEKSCASRTMVS